MNTDSSTLIGFPLELVVAFWLICITGSIVLAVRQSRRDSW